MNIAHLEWCNLGLGFLVGVLCIFRQKGYQRSTWLGKAQHNFIVAKSNYEIGCLRIYYNNKSHVSAAIWTRKPFLVITVVKSLSYSIG